VPVRGTHCNALGAQTISAAVSAIFGAVHGHKIIAAFYVESC
jgi:hypothetical protein